MSDLVQSTKRCNRQSMGCTPRGVHPGFEIAERVFTFEQRLTEQQAQIEIEETLQHFPSNLPTKRDSTYAAWVSISVGCNNTCTFCIVPSLRGKEKDRRPGEILAEELFA